MNHQASLLIAVAVGALMLPQSACVAANVRIEPIENWSTAFGGGDVRIGMRVIEAAEGTLRWSHAANQRTLARGEVELRRNEDGSGTGEFVLRPPEVRDGVIFETTVTTEFIPRGANEAAASLERTLWLFPRNPIAGQTTWAENLDIELFDPEGDTAEQFEKLELPHRVVRNTAALNNPEQDGVLIIGEGASLVRNRSLAGAVLKAAAAGRRVVLLAPADGSFPLPGLTGNDVPDGAAPGEVRLARHQIITELDKRLDAQAWPGTNNTIPSRGLLLESRRGRIETVITDESSQAWPWLVVRFPQSRGVLVMCGFTLIEHWENGPTPRFLLVRLLESLQRASDRNDVND